MSTLNGYRLPEAGVALSICTQAANRPSTVKMHKIETNRLLGIEYVLSICSPTEPGDECLVLCLVRTARNFISTSWSCDDPIIAGLARAVIAWMRDSVLVKKDRTGRGPLVRV
jgi:hypothetical protein